MQRKHVHQVLAELVQKEEEVREISGQPGVGWLKDVGVVPPIPNDDHPRETRQLCIIDNPMLKSASHGHRQFQVTNEFCTC